MTDVDKMRKIVEQIPEGAMVIITLSGYTFNLRNIQEYGVYGIRDADVTDLTANFLAWIRDIQSDQIPEFGSLVTSIGKNDTALRFENNSISLDDILLSMSMLHL